MSQPIVVFKGPNAEAEARAYLAGHSARWPHYTCSATAMVGTESYADEQRTYEPGECVVAGGGALVLSDLPEWRHETIEAVGQAHVNGYITIPGHPVQIGRSRSFERRVRTTFQLVVTHQLCPCGHPDHSRCSCTVPAKKRFNDRVNSYLYALRHGRFRA